MALSTDGEEILRLAQQLEPDDRLELAERLIAGVQRRPAAQSVENGAEETKQDLRSPIDLSDPEVSISDLPMVGIWSDREDMSDPVEWVRKLRRDEWDRNS